MILLNVNYNKTTQTHCIKESSQRECELIIVCFLCIIIMKIALSVVVQLFIIIYKVAKLIIKVVCEVLRF
jgi:hypothetical protein